MLTLVVKGAFVPSEYTNVTSDFLVIDIERTDEFGNVEVCLFSPFLVGETNLKFICSVSTTSHSHIGCEQKMDVTNFRK